VYKEAMGQVYLKYFFTFSDVTLMMSELFPE